MPRLAKSTKRKDYTYIGIDGEGVGRKPEPGGHRYILLAAVNEAGDKRWWIEAGPGECLTSEQCLEFILGLQGSTDGKPHKLYAYSFNYDLTKILTDLSNDAILLLFRTDWRQRKGKWAKLGPWPIRWNGFDINLQGTKFSVSSSHEGIREHIILWDIWK